jgi:SNF2 family DNA or RNA helicase
MTTKTKETDYSTFIERKSQLGSSAGFEPLFMPDFLFPFQRALVEWAVRKGRCAIFADCGLGKTPMQLVWAQNVVERTCKPVLVLTPLSVGAQTIREAAKFGIEAKQSRDGTIAAPITVTNYQQLHKFDCSNSAAWSAMNQAFSKVSTDQSRHR